MCASVLSNTTKEVTQDNNLVITLIGPSLPLPSKPPLPPLLPSLHDLVIPVWVEGVLYGWSGLLFLQLPQFHHTEGVTLAIGVLGKQVSPFNQRHFQSSHTVSQSTHVYIACEGGGKEEFIHVLITLEPTSLNVC